MVPIGSIFFPLERDSMRIIALKGIKLITDKI